MHPAGSIILFTTAAGTGYGLLFVLGLGAPLGLLPAGRGLGLAGLGLALGLITVGLLASSLHLRHPERAWRAFSQWRSSWLSREGVAALVTYLPTALFALGWIGYGATGGPWALAGLLAALGALVTVGCTGMIYASLQPIRQWHDPWVVPVYLGFALAGGLLWLDLLARLAGADAGWTGPALIVALAAVWAMKLFYWRGLARKPPESTPESATGLGAIGRVRLLEPPHSEANYLLNEMGFRIGRKHAARLRRLAFAFGLAAPLVLALLGLFLTGGPGVVVSLLAAFSGSLGIVIERWLFFAEARHSVILYYGEREI